jgi:uncharacterized protein (UPF0303 family)
MDIHEELRRIALQEERLRFERLDSEVAWELAEALKTAGEERGSRLAFDIATPSVSLLSHVMAEASPDNAEWVRRKRNVTLRFFRSSYAVGLELRRDGQTLRQKFGLRDDDYMAHGGSFPVRLEGSPLVIGAVTVSGLPQRDDHDLVTRALAAFLGVPVGEVALNPI